MKLTSFLTTSVALACLSGFAVADQSASLIIDGETLVTTAPAPDHLENLSEIYSGWVFRSDETQVLQMDDFENPAFVFIDQAEELYATVDGTAGKACIDCHADVEEFAGLRARMPRVMHGDLQTMEEAINGCRTERMGAEAWKWSGTQMTSMTALIGLQSRGLPVDVVIDGEAAPFWERGKELYYQRTGQLDLSCANCHEDNYDNLIRADHLSQGQINGFPTYRLKNAKLNSIHARFKGCVRDTRATPYAEGSDEFKALELYVASRANGLSVETPSVRN